jgi:phosphoenolpyruvate synthase/pyruvate phosphate dikinase
VLSTEGFDSFIAENDLQELATADLGDREITRLFLASKFPDWLKTNLDLFVRHALYPLAVRSSSMLEDAQFQPFAGIYKTYMLPNVDPNPALRLKRLIMAIKLVYASTYCRTPKSYVKNTFHRLEDEKMAVVIQKLTGTVYDDVFYPAVSGVVQSYNFYPISHMRPEEGIVRVALGLGKTVVEGETSFRFSPIYPQFLPQFPSVDDYLKNTQRSFYVLKMKDFPQSLDLNEDATLAKMNLEDAKNHPAVKYLTSSYSIQDHRIRDGGALLTVGSAYR